MSMSDVFFSLVGIGFAIAVEFRGFETLAYIIQRFGAWFLSRFKKDR